jgi:O-antigen/teichoic acid export membrane protein
MLTLGLLWKEFVGFKFTINWPKLKEVLVYAYPLMIMGLAGAINLTADRLMFRELLPEGFYPDFPKPDQAFSIYSQVYKLSIFMTLVVQAYRYAADPLFFSKMGDRNSPNLIALSTKWFTIACIILWVGVSLNLDWIGLLIGENYRSGLYIVPILLLANLFIGVYGNTSIWFKLVDKTPGLAIVTVKVEPRNPIEASQ